MIFPGPVYSAAITRATSWLSQPSILSPDSCSSECQRFSPFWMFKRSNPGKVERECVYRVRVTFWYLGEYREFDACLLHVGRWGKPEVPMRFAVSLCFSFVTQTWKWRYCILESTSVAIQVRREIWDYSGQGVEASAWEARRQRWSQTQLNQQGAGSRC